MFSRIVPSDRNQQKFEDPAKDIISSDLFQESGSLWRFDR